MKQAHGAATRGGRHGPRLLATIAGLAAVSGTALAQPDPGAACAALAGRGVAAGAIGIPDLHPHQLRHTAASLAIASGADVKVVQQMLGHASATMTLDTYGHLFEDRLDEVGDALDRARTAAQQRRNNGEVLPRVARALPDPKSAEKSEEGPFHVSAGQDPNSLLYPRRDSNPRYRLERAAC